MLLFAFSTFPFLTCAHEGAEEVSEVKAEDEIITGAIKMLLVDEADIPAVNIKVQSKCGVVTVSGQLDTRLQANRVIELISSVNNVVDIDARNLKIKSSNEYLTDSFITAKAKGKIRQLAFKGVIKDYYDLHVETTNKVVHVFGEVGNERDIATIRRHLQEIVGVKFVQMNIIVNECN